MLHINCQATDKLFNAYCPKWCPVICILAQTGKFVGMSTKEDTKDAQRGTDDRSQVFVDPSLRGRKSTVDHVCSLRVAVGALRRTYTTHNYSIL